MSPLNNIWPTLFIACALAVGYPSVEFIPSTPPAPTKPVPTPRIGSPLEVHPVPGALTPCSTEQIFYDKGRLKEKLVLWNNQPWERTVFEYFDDVSLYSVQTLVYHDKRPSVMRKDLFRISYDDALPDRKIETRHYFFDKDSVNGLRQIDWYWPDTTLVRERDIFDASGELKATARFEYDLDPAVHGPDENETISTVTRMTVINAAGEVVSDYRETTVVDLDSIYTREHLSDAEIRRRKQISQDPTRIPILIMDSGIDISHPDLAYKLWRNPHEMPNGEDDDGNDLIDDIYGISDNPRLGQPVQDLRLPRFGLPAFSHGTLVASIATQGREDVAIMAASEVTTINSADILPMVERFIQDHAVRFTTMSFIYDRQLLASGANADRPHQIMQLISNTPDTLHVVAAGNGAPINGRGFNMDHYRRPGDLVPAMLPQDNILVVGALDTTHLDLSDYPAYEVASFSNVGESSVDILAPGTQMCGARMGGGHLCQDGTSFAAPYVLNHGVLAVAKANPDLSIHEIKEILIKSAYIPDLDYPLPVRSGGILHPQRATAVARWLAENPADSVETSVLAVRKAELTPIPGERNDDAYLSALPSFWALRQIDPAPSWYARLKGGAAHMD